MRPHISEAWLTKVTAGTTVSDTAVVSEGIVLSDDQPVGGCSMGVEIDLEVAQNAAGTTDDMLVEVYPALDGDPTHQADIPVDSYVLATSTGAKSLSFTVPWEVVGSGVVLQFSRTGATDTLKITRCRARRYTYV